MNSDANRPPVSPAKLKHQTRAISQATAALESLNEQLHRLAHDSPLAIVATAGDGNVIRWTAAAERLFGWSATEVLVRPSPLLNTAQSAAARTTDPAASHPVSRTVERHQRKDGTFVDVSHWSAPLRDKPGSILGRLGLYVDITDRSRAKAELEKSEERFEKAFRASPAGLVICRLRDLLLLEANTAFLELFELNLEQAIGRTPDELGLIGKTELAELREALVTHGHLTNTELLVRTHAGQPRHIIFSAEVIEVHGEPSAIVTLCDITARKQAQAQMRELSIRLMRAEDEERRRIAKELHDSTAQDLVAAMMTLDTLREDAQGKNAEKLDDALAILERCAHDIRTLSYVLHPPQLSESGLAAAISHYASGFAQRTGLRLTLELPETLERPGEEVERTLFRVMQESLGNIHRHARSETAAIRIAREPQGWILEIRDAGRGIPPAVLEAGEDLQHGPGVGIPAMRERLRQIGGRLEIQSGPNGTTIRALLPTTPPNENDSHSRR